MKSYYLVDVTAPGALEACLGELFPGQTHPWLLLSEADDPVAYFHIESENLVMVDVSGRHFNEDEAVLGALEALRARVGGAIHSDQTVDEAYWIPRQRKVERAFRKARRQALLTDLSRSRLTWALLIAFFGGLTYYTATPRGVVDVVYGTATGAHQPASEDNSVDMRISVRLRSNRTVNMPIPRGTPYLAGSEVEIEVIRREWPPHTETYRFVRYVSRQ